MALTLAAATASGAHHPLARHRRAGERLVNIINRTPPERYRHAIVCLTEAGEFAKRIVAPDVPVIELHKRPGHDLGLYWRLLKTLRATTGHRAHAQPRHAGDAVRRRSAARREAGSRRTWSGRVRPARQQSQVQTCCAGPPDWWCSAISQSARTWSSGWSALWVSPAKVTSDLQRGGPAHVPSARRRQAGRHAARFPASRRAGGGTVGRLAGVKNQLSAAARSTTALAGAPGACREAAGDHRR